LLVPPANDANLGKGKQGASTRKPTNGAEKSMRISSVEEYVRIEPLDDPTELELTHAQFPYRVVVECDFPEWDVANRWCWQNFGPRHGECWSQLEYATCPLIFPTEHIVKAVVPGKEYELKRYSNVHIPHHVGIWTTYWFGKTEYDHGYGEFSFIRENNKAKFWSIFRKLIGVKTIRG
jgi:hypothetical protein